MDQREVEAGSGVRSELAGKTYPSKTFLRLSTAEAELLGYGEAHQEGESFLALLQILELGVSQAVIHGDNRAALVMCNQDTGPWRTRHLRLRASKLREVLQCPDPAWRAEYMAGWELVADGSTKPLQGQSFSKFVQRLGMTLDEEPQVRRLQMKAEAARHDRWKSAVPLLAMLGCSLLKVNEVLGSLLVLLAGLVNLKWEGTRSNQERHESQEMTRKGGRTTIQDGNEATPQDGNEATLQEWREGHTSRWRQSHTSRWRNGHTSRWQKGHSIFTCRIRKARHSCLQGYGRHRTWRRCGGRSDADGLRSGECGSECGSECSGGFSGFENELEGEFSCEWWQCGSCGKGFKHGGHLCSADRWRWRSWT